MNIEENDVDEYKVHKKNKVLKLIIIVGCVILIGIALIGTLFQDNEQDSTWYANINEEKIIQSAKNKIEKEFSGAASISYWFGEIEYKEEDYNDKYYFMFYTVTATVTNQFNAKTKYYCSVKICMNKETREYTVYSPVCNKILN